MPVQCAGIGENGLLPVARKKEFGFSSQYLDQTDRRLDGSHYPDRPNTDDQTPTNRQTASFRGPPSFRGSRLRLWSPPVKNTASMYSVQQSMCRECGPHGPGADANSSNSDCALMSPPGPARMLGILEPRWIAWLLFSLLARFMAEQAALCRYRN